MNRVEKDFWMYVARLGYPTSPEGVEYGSRSHRELENIRRFFELDRRRLEGKPLGWPACSFYSGYLHRYRDVHWALVLAMRGRAEMLRVVEKDMEGDLNHLESEVSRLIRNIRELERWSDEGGLVSYRSVAAMVKSGGSTGFSGVLNMYESLFGEHRERWLVERLKLLGIPPDDIEKIRGAFGRYRRRALMHLGRVEKLLRDLAEKTGLDHEELRNVLL